MRVVEANDETGKWDVFDDAGVCWLASFESKSLAYEFAIAGDLIAGVRAILNECFVSYIENDYEKSRANLDEEDYNYLFNLIEKLEES